jgi:hypothetical protein
MMNTIWVIGMLPDIKKEKAFSTDLENYFTKAALIQFPMGWESSMTSKTSLFTKESLTTVESKVMASSQNIKTFTLMKELSMPMPSQPLGFLNSTPVSQSSPIRFILPIIHSIRPKLSLKTEDTTRGILACKPFCLMAMVFLSIQTALSMKEGGIMDSFMVREGLFGPTDQNMRGTMLRVKNMDLASLFIHLKRFMKAVGSMAIKKEMDHSTTKLAIC